MVPETVFLNREIFPFRERRLSYISGDSVDDFYYHDELNFQLETGQVLPMKVGGMVINVQMIPLNTYLPYDRRRSFSMDTWEESDQTSWRRKVMKPGILAGTEVVKCVVVPENNLLLSVHFGEDENRDGWDAPRITLKSLFGIPLPEQIASYLSSLKLRVFVNGLSFDSICQVSGEKATVQFDSFYPTEIGEPMWREVLRKGDQIGLPILREHRRVINQWVSEVDIEVDPALEMILMRANSDTERAEMIKDGN